MLGHVAHALERGAHAQGGDDDAQVAGDGLLAGEDLDGELVELDGLLVDDRVGFDDLFCEGDVAGSEGTRGAVDRDRHEVGDLDQAALDVLEGLVEYFAHRGYLPRRRHGTWVSRNPRGFFPAKVNEWCCDSE